MEGNFSLAGEIPGTYKCEFLGSVAVDGSWHKPLRACVVWLNSSVITAAEQPRIHVPLAFFSVQPDRRALQRQTEQESTCITKATLLSISGLWGCCLSDLSCFWCAVTALATQFPSHGLPWCSSASNDLCALADKSFTVAVMANLISIPPTQGE